MKLPDPVSISDQMLHALAEQHGLQVDGFRALPQTGIINTIYQLSNHLILRVPRDHPDHIEQIEREALVVPAARAAGVRTPELLVFDDSRSVLPVPYTIYERVPGETLGLLALEPTDTPGAWRELGRDLALLHTCVGNNGPAGQLPPAWDLPEPRQRTEELASEGHFSTSEARWLINWLEHLAPIALTAAPARCLHGDTQATNIIVEPESHRYRALIDWGNAAWGDVALEASGMPLRAVPYMLEGHRAVAPLDGDETIEARILWRQLQVALLILPRRPDSQLAAAERPLTILLEILRFLLSDPPQPWQELQPPGL